MSGILLPRQERRALAAAKKPQIVTCPECDGPAESKSGSWRCSRNRVYPNTSPPVKLLLCGASGTVMPDSTLAVLRGTSLSEEALDVLTQTAGKK